MIALVLPVLFVSNDPTATSTVTTSGTSTETSTVTTSDTSTETSTVTSTATTTPTTLPYTVQQSACGTGYNFRNDVDFQDAYGVVVWHVDEFAKPRYASIKTDGSATHAYYWPEDDAYARDTYQTGESAVCLRQPRCTYLQKVHGLTDNCNKDVPYTDRLQLLDPAHFGQTKPVTPISECILLKVDMHDVTDECNIPTDRFEFFEQYYALCQEHCVGRAAWATPQVLEPCTGPDGSTCRQQDLSNIEALCNNPDSAHFRTNCPVLCVQCQAMYIGDFKDQDGTAFTVSAPGDDCTQLFHRTLTVNTTLDNALDYGCNLFRNGTLSFSNTEINGSAFFNTCWRACNISEWSAEETTMITCVTNANAHQEYSYTQFITHYTTCAGVDNEFGQGCVFGSRPDWHVELSQSFTDLMSHLCITTTATTTITGTATTSATLTQTTTGTVSESTTATTTASTTVGPTTSTVTAIPENRYYRITFELAATTATAEELRTALLAELSTVVPGVQFEVVIAPLAAPMSGSYRRRREATAYTVEVYAPGTATPEQVAAVIALTAVGGDPFVGEPVVANVANTPAPSTTTTTTHTHQPQPQAPAEPSGYIGGAPEFIVYLVCALFGVAVIISAHGYFKSRGGYEPVVSQ